MSSVPSRPTDRYGAPLVSRRTARILGAVTAVLFVLGVIVVGTWISRTPVRYDLVSYEHLADDRLEATFAVTMPPGTAADCQVQALNEGRAQVGFVEVRIQAQTERTTSHTVEISTQGSAVSAEVIGCDPV
ncbi:DUF4307 domain-containing protein [Brachybacterium sp. J153]|uniref:DUF4307 domain-containing protein n=1 Tax=Brachybacterium sp. J153 TaxID=3116488 RepID=UPI002E789F78|nr:DUF4307 domain-containing protein [Brachybacterium sp. J153]MEE1618268.1 DUF4307 domain-containing protein [Brachybacterium sp. J153]